MALSLNKIFTLRNIITDVAILICIYFIPALSHVAPFPLYLLDPMRILMLAGYVLTRQNANAYILALTIPLFSSLVTGHPPLFKSLLISIELSVNLYLYIQLLNRSKLHIAFALFLSIIGSKLVYYTLKFVFIATDLIEGALITTDLLAQLGTTIFVSFVFYLIWINTNELKNEITK